VLNGKDGNGGGKQQPTVFGTMKLEGGGRELCGGLAQQEVSAAITHIKIKA
jgi:hypothetical protein